MQKYLCKICDYLYDPEKGDPDGGIAPGTAFEDIPDSWVCPICRQPKSVFIPIAQDNPRTYSSVAEANLDEIL